MQRQGGFRRGTAGFTMVETLIAITLLTIGLVSIGVLVVSSTRQTELEDDRQRVLESARNLLEQVKASDPQLIVQTFDGQQYEVPDVDGDVAVSIDATDPALLGVTVTADWNSAGSGMSLVLETQIYNSKG